MPTSKLTNAKIKNAGPGKYGDGAGLQLVVSEAGNRRWVYRYMLDKRSREMGLGSYPDIDLKAARERATKYRKLAKDGIDPIEFREQERRDRRLSDAQRTTFRQCAEDCIESLKPGWKNAKHAKQWSSTLETHAYPVLGDEPVGAIDSEMVLKVLKPIWSEIPETASRVRGRIETVLDWASAHGYRSGENPARWRGHLKRILPERNRVAPVRHFPALPYAELPDFFESLSEQPGQAAKALRLLILTAARTSEVINATWDEFDTEKGIWTIPAERMKAGRPHRVPLSSEASRIIEEIGVELQPPYLFPGRNHKKPMSNTAMLALLKRMGRSDFTVHGFRSTFRDWAAEQTSFPREVAEAALAHVISDKTEAAYQRGDLFDKRRKLMDAWAGYCSSTRSDTVVPIVRKL